MRYAILIIYRATLHSSIVALFFLLFCVDHLVASHGATTWSHELEYYYYFASRINRKIVRKYNKYSNDGVGKKEKSKQPGAFAYINVDVRAPNHHHMVDHNRHHLNTLARHTHAHVHT